MRYQYSPIDADQLLLAISPRIVGGLRAGLGYAGAANLQDLRNKARFTRITNAGLIESHPHDVTITKESSNYGIQE